TVDADVMQERCQLILRVSGDGFTYAGPRLCHSDPALRPGVLCGSTFLLVLLLPSIDSAAGRPALFADFLGTTNRSDCSTPFIIGFDLLVFPMRPRLGLRGSGGALPVPVQETYVRTRVSDDAEPGSHSRCRDCLCCLLPLREHRLSELHGFRRS